MGSDAYGRTAVQVNPAGVGLRDFLSAKDAPWSAKFDGVTDDSTGLGNAQKGASTLWLPNGTSIVQASIFNVKQSKQRIRGQGMDSTVIRGAGTLTSVIASTGFNSQVEISDLTLDAQALATLFQVLLVRGSTIGRLTLRNIRFINAGALTMINAQNVAQLIVEDCVADNGGLGTGNFISCTDQDLELLIARRNRIRWVSSAFLIGASGAHQAHMEITENYVDLGWWLLKSLASNSGGTVSYTQGVNGGATGTLTDTAANFGTGSGTVKVGQIVRVMTPKQTGTLTSASTGNFMADTAASFVANGVIRGEIVRTATSFAVVKAVESATVLHLEEWLDLNTYQPVTPPASGTAYTVYGLLLGLIQGVANTQLTIGQAFGFWGFTDLNGVRPGTIAAGTLYEVNPKPAYPYQFAGEAEEILLANNVGRRGYGDTFSVFGMRARILGNLSEDSFDSGYTLQPGGGSVITGNRSRHAGNVGLGFYGGATTQGIEIGPNIAEDTGWATPNAGFVFVAAINAKMTGGQSYVNTGVTGASYGAYLHGACSGVSVKGFSGRGHSVSDVRVHSDVTAAVNRILDTDGTISYTATANGQYTRHAGTGAPAIPASPGSQFHRTDGGAGTSLYIKESANDATGWVGK